MFGLRNPRKNEVVLQIKINPYTWRENLEHTQILQLNIARAMMPCRFFCNCLGGVEKSIKNNIDKSLIKAYLQSL